MLRPGLRLALVALVVALPLASAQSLPLPTPTAPALQPPTTATPTVAPSAAPTAAPTLPGAPEPIAIVEDRLELAGSPLNPERLLLKDADGAPLLDYRVDAEGRASLSAGGVTLLEDATFLRIDGDPLGDAFTLVLRDAEGGTHAFTVDRAALDALPPLPEGATLPEGQAPPIEALRPPTWPLTPQKSYLLFVEDAARNHVAAAKLDGSAYLQRGGQHAAVVQVPLDELRWDRVLLEVGKAGGATHQNVTFERQRDTESAAIFLARYDLASLALLNGETVELRVLFERRLAPIVVERVAEPAAYRARVDGQGPTVTLQAPAQSDDFRFALSWGGTDAHSGVGSFHVQYRVAGASTWYSWLAPTMERSATFSGDWGTTYEFRAYALDAVGNPSPTPATATTAVLPAPTTSGDGSNASAQTDVNDAPSARLLAPRSGDVLAGVASITWEATDADAAPLTSRLQVSSDGGATWRTLFAGHGDRATWDTSSETDGSYSLRLTVTDGTRSVQDVVGDIVVRNVVSIPEAEEPGAAVPSAAPSAPSAPGAQPAAGGGGQAQEAPRDPADGSASDADATKGAPMPSFLLVALVVGAAALALRRR